MNSLFCSLFRVSEHFNDVIVLVDCLSYCSGRGLCYSYGLLHIHKPHEKQSTADSMSIVFENKRLLWFCAIVLELLPLVLSVFVQVQLPKNQFSSTRWQVSKQCKQCSSPFTDGLRSYSLKIIISKIDRTRGYISIDLHQIPTDSIDLGNKDLRWNNIDYGIYRP